MPVITVEGPLMNKDKKEQLAKEITRVAAKIVEVPEKAVIVLLKENGPDNIGVGGTLMSNS